MYRKGIFLFALLFTLSLAAQALPSIKVGAYMQKVGRVAVRPIRTFRGKTEKVIPPKPKRMSFQGTRAGKQTPRVRNTVVRTASRSRTTAKEGSSHKANTVQNRSTEANKKASARLEEFARRSSQPHHRTVSAADKAALRNAVFEVQISRTPRNTASAFALDINGHIWGVTASHVMENIHTDPFAKVKTASGEIVAPITSFIIGNKKGNDVALFEIPQEILPHVKVLQPAKQLPAVGTETQAPRFVWGQFAFFPEEDILFAGEHRILMRDGVRQDITGSCGAPILANGEVIGVHVGSFSLHTMETISWSTLLHEYQIVPKESLHVASPIRNVLQLDAQAKGVPQVGTTLAVSTHPVYLMAPQEYLVSIALMRNGSFKKEILAHPFMNFGHLEEFFELQENDVLRISVGSPKPYSSKTITKIIDINVSTGEVTQVGSF